MCIFKKTNEVDSKTQTDELASVEDLMTSGVCEECDQDPAQCWLKDFCVYGHTEAVL